MAKNLGKELFRTYSILWYKYKDKEFEFQHAMSLLNKKRIASEKPKTLKSLSVEFTKLKKAGWMKASALKSDDSRIRSYKLRTPTEIIEDTGKQ
jgi:hypothetical protein